MTLTQFNQLDETEQIEAVWSGIQIGERSDADHDILLYQIGKLYVEVFYNRETNGIRKFNAFEDLEQMQPYLHKLNIRF
jgi:hypothetical protein